MTHNKEYTIIPIEPLKGAIRLMDKILHDPKDPKLWELWYIPYSVVVATLISTVDGQNPALPIIRNMP